VGVAWAAQNLAGKKCSRHKVIVYESVFVIKTFFFISFGYLIEAGSNITFFLKFFFKKSSLSKKNVYFLKKKIFNSFFY